LNRDDVEGKRVKEWDIFYHLQGYGALELGSKGEDDLAYNSGKKKHSVLHTNIVNDGEILLG
jgi:hypothetical protein